ncbi:hypothetical protein NAI82_10805, partial [Oxalobacter sp. JAC-2022]
MRPDRRLCGCRLAAQGIDILITNGAHPEALCDIVAGRAGGDAVCRKEVNPGLDTGNGDVSGV